MTKEIKLFDYSGSPTSKALSFGNATIYFSYETIIAVEDSDGLIIRENSWSKTTGKHLNAINSNHDLRISGEEFKEKLKGFLAKHFIYFSQQMLDKLKDKEIVING